MNDNIDECIALQSKVNEARANMINHTYKPAIEKSINNLTNAESERLAILTEELGEALQSVGKILRHGYESFDPTNQYHKGNRNDLVVELKDVVQAINLLIDAGDIQLDLNSIPKIKKYTHYQ
jgi:hypothetical protein